MFHGANDSIKIQELNDCNSPKIEKRNYKIDILFQ